MTYCYNGYIYHHVEKNVTLDTEYVQKVSIFTKIKTASESLVLLSFSNDVG